MMLNCNLLLDSVARFGLKEGTTNTSRDARKTQYSGDLCCIL